MASAGLPRSQILYHFIALTCTEECTAVNIYELHATAPPCRTHLAFHHPCVRRHQFFLESLPSFPFLGFSVQHRRNTGHYKFHAYWHMDVHPSSLGRRTYGKSLAIIPFHCRHMSANSDSSG
ncbi:hypothetical protein P692DRAFT_20426120 [Suillus brevipes Sb2]|nr:hypothetical protein P692DRAFT_20426120 [Suillus brevipes Sb2]